MTRRKRRAKAHRARMKIASYMEQLKKHQSQAVLATLKGEELRATFHKDKARTQQIKILNMEELIRRNLGPNYKY